MYKINVKDVVVIYLYITHKTLYMFHSSCQLQNVVKSLCTQIMTSISL